MISIFAVEVVKEANYCKVPVIIILFLELYHYIVPILPSFHVGQVCALNQGKVPWKSIYTLLPIPVDEKNPGDNGYMMKILLSPVQYV